MAQSDDPQLYRVEPDDPSDLPSDVGVQSSTIGTFMPVGTYRPVPIVHFAGTILVQILVLLVLFGVLYSKAGIFTIATGALVTFGLGKRAFGRWLGDASMAWKIATIAMLAFNLLLVSLGSLGR
jgi:hypothetical protein